MEKYTVDIDKVLDDFEQSEALEAANQSVENCAGQSNKTQNRKSFTESLLCNHSHEANASVDNCSEYIYSRNPSNSYSCPSKSKLESSFTTSSKNIVHCYSDQISSACNAGSFEVFTQPFQCPSNSSYSTTHLSNNFVTDTNQHDEQHSLICAISTHSSAEEISQISLVNSWEPDTSESLQLANENNNIHLLGSVLENYTESYSSDITINKESLICCDKTQSSEISCITANGVTSGLTVDKESKNELQAENMLCLDELPSSHEMCSVSLSNGHESGSSETNDKQPSGSYACDSINVISPKDVPKCESEHNEQVANYSFNAEEHQMSAAEIEEIFNDTHNNYQVQDDDSGVSSQEETNGLNLGIELLSDGNYSSSENPPNNSETDWNSIPGAAITSVNNIIVEKNLECVLNNDLHQSLTNTNGNDIASAISVDVAQSTDQGFLKKESEVAYPSKLECLQEAKNNSDLLDNENITSGLSTLIKNVYVNDEESHDKLTSLETYDCSQLHSDNNGHTKMHAPAVSISNAGDNIPAEIIPEMKLIFSPSDGTFRSVPCTEVATSNSRIASSLDVDHNDNKYDVEVEGDASNISDSNSYPSRLQRPTTLNLPSRSIAASNAVDSCTETSDAASSNFIEVPRGQAVSEATEAEHPENEILLSKIGKIKPFWIPDSSATNCMHCDIKFTVIKRRHHCRACGKVLCSRCCNQKARLPYLSNKEDRVCQQCFEILAFNEAEQEKGCEKEEIENGESPISSSCGSSPSFSPSSNLKFQQKNSCRPHPNNPDDYCSTISPLQQVEELANRPPPTVMVPVGVLKRGNKPRGVPKQVIFSDGIRPGGDLTDLTESADMAPPFRRPGRRIIDKSTDSGSISNSNETIKKRVPKHKAHHKRVIVSDSEGPLPPILLPHDSVKDAMDLDTLFTELRGEESAPVVFAVTKNVHVLTKIIKLDCCFGGECWCFASRGLCTVGQDEVILVLELFQDENVVPRDVFRMYSKLYDNASKGITVGELGHLVFPDGIFGSWEHRGFLFVRPTFQCLSKLILPNSPYLFAILIQKWEVPWAKVFPLRLMLRLGAECRYYPCSLVSVRFRKPLYFEIGQTIMSVLSDLRNFQFTIPFVPGLVIHMEEKKTCVNIPRNRYEKLMKVLNSNNVEHVLSLGANFSTEADSHLVCIQKDDGDYQTQAINIQHTTRKVTGASFIVFSGALKTSTGLSAKFSIVEDGLLVQIPQETMSELHSALHDMRNLEIKCGKINAPEPEEIVVIQWTAEDRKFNIGVTSPIDQRSLEGIPNLRIHTATDYAGDSYLIRWTEVFFLEDDSNVYKRRFDSTEPCRIAETVAQPFCMSLIPYLDALVEAEMTKIGLRILLDAKKDMVEYDVGSQGQNLPSKYMNALDSSLVPVLSRMSVAHQEEPVSLELIFYILIK